jgi:hypothetical protein
LHISKIARRKMINVWDDGYVDYPD